MMFKCGLCERTRFGKKHYLNYSALNDEGIPEQYIMNMCVKCATEMQKHGKERDKAEKIIPEEDSDGD